MIPLHDLLLFAGASLLMVLTPGPNMVYLISRSICQGRKAGAISLLGVVAGFVLHMLAAAIGLSALFLAIPIAYDALRWLGAAYLLYLAWQAVKPGARSPFEAKDLPQDSTAKLFLMGFMTNALNPKIAIFYLSIFPQFITPEHGSAFVQSLQLGLTQIGVSFSVNLAIVFSAGSLALWFTRHPQFIRAQRFIMGGVLATLAIRLATEPRKAI